MRVANDPKVSSLWKGRTGETTTPRHYLSLGDTGVSSRREPAQRAVYDYALNNFAKNTSEFTGTKAAAPRQLWPFRRTGNHQQPSSTGTLGNILTRDPASTAINSERLWCAFRLSTMSSSVWLRSLPIS